jgi:hypothetical protein
MCPSEPEHLPDVEASIGALLNRCREELHSGKLRFPGPSVKGAKRDLTAPGRTLK